MSEVSIRARIREASNATFLADLDGTPVVYKPIEGERPLWDFPDGTLAGREVAAHLVSEAFGWGIVPPTWLGDGPFGPGMLQRWQEIDPAQDAVDLVPPGDAEAPDSTWLPVLEAIDEHEQPVTLVHEDSEQLRRMAVFDVVVNNADRKGGHVLAMPDGHRYGVDHGLTFHVEHKLRTVLWGWIGEPLSADELEGIDRVTEALRGDLGQALEEHLTVSEIDTLRARCAALRAVGIFPPPPGHGPAVPWPLF
ncbi:putative repeat protein (TIGR03843 family) [Curtobacterium luteum]|uniref:Putative phosphatidylinositol 3-and 4-kinase n=1 Tax=Curtobacterium luteum TaxID=33881 RepID=A0A8H9GBK6_9MICO|nr:SCO1664 family protein [Curtobacterium luteum]MBM7802501.1 putative repeat protein (TIGR03843 family) [Curtobacterium luteum]NUU50436.1 SCO1664 family protein [Curtobacterium luteum]GGL07398.1 putative phosphatidylinositol 3-and 4-kinase [Curtobacterium luteum]